MDNWRQEYEDAITERNLLIMETQRLRAALERVEWVTNWPARKKRQACPWCDNLVEFNHDRNCPRQLALGISAVARAVADTDTFETASMAPEGTP